MRSIPTGEVTSLLLAWGQGEESALQKLIPVVHDELHRLAHRYMRGEHPGHILQTTALVNEVYLRLVDSNRVNWRNRAHFFAICAQLMRQILVDFARSQRSLKRGGLVQLVPIDETPAAGGETSCDLIALDEALNALAATDRRKSQVVELRFFGGLSVEDTAAALEVSRETVLRDWKFAKAWLLRRLSEQDADGR